MWTLHLEAWFYLLLPLLMAGILVVGAGRPGAGLLVITVAGVTSMLLHVGLGIAVDPGVARVGSLSLPAMLWAFLPGVAIAWMDTRWPLRRAALGDSGDRAWPRPHRPRWLGSLVSPLGLASGTSRSRPGRGAHAHARIVRQPEPHERWSRRGRRSRPGHRGLAWFGRCVSYPFYLWHVPILGVAVAAGVTGWTAFGVVLMVAGAIGYVSWRLVEAPAMRAASLWSGRDVPGPSDARHDARVTAIAGAGPSGG